jgi:hypothetical protein
MTVIATIPQKVYNPQTFNSPFSVPSGVKALKATFTRVSWPVGEVATVQIIYPDGTSPGTVGFSGGTSLAKDGTNTSAIGIGDPSGADLPAGTYTIQAIVTQAITTQITLERF